MFNTVLFVGFDEPGGTYDHVPPGPVPPPDPVRAPGQLGFAFDRSGYRVPAVIVSPWVPLGHRLHRRVPAHLDAGDPARGVEPRASRSPPVMRPRVPSTSSSAWRRHEHPRPWPTSTHCRCPPSRRSRWTACGHWAHWAVTCATASTSTPATTTDLPDPPDSDPEVSPALAIDFAVHLGRGCSRDSPDHCRRPEELGALRTPCWAERTDYPGHTDWNLVLSPSGS